MPIISQKSIKAVKDNIRISDVFEWLGAKVVQKGRNTMAFCPFCEDANSRNPGCSLNDANGFFHCFAAGTMVLTKGGPEPIETLVGKTVEILNGNGEWEAVQFRCYGEQALWAIDIAYGEEHRLVRATDKHRWFSNCGKELLTCQLEPGMELASIVPFGSVWQPPLISVVDAKETPEVEKVYCCQTSTGSFALDGYILTGNCFVCGAGGDLITAVQQHEECSFPEAVEMLAQHFNIPLEYEESNDPERESRRKRYVSVLERALEMFQDQKKDPHWAQFVKDRRLSDEAIERFELCLSLMSEADGVVKTLLSEGFTEDELVGAGLCYRKEETGEIVLRFKNRAIFPIRTAPGTLIGFGGRDLTGRSNAKYINSPESELFKKRTVLYGIDHAKRPMGKKKRIVVCEGYMDTIALQTHGVEEAVGAMGTALTPYNLTYLSNFAEVMYISLDSDIAGVNAAMKTADIIPPNFPSAVRVLSMPQITVENDDDLKRSCGEKLYAETLKEHDGEIPYPITVPVAKDPDEFFNERGKTLRDFESALREADDLFLFCAMRLVDDVIADLDVEMNRERPDASTIARCKQEAMRRINGFIVSHYEKTNIYQRQNIANWMIDALRLIDTFENMEGEWRRQASIQGNRYAQSAPIDIEPAAAPVFTSAHTKEEDLLIGTLYYHPETRETIKQNIEDIKLVFTSPVREAIFDKLNEGLSKNLDVNAITADFSEDETKELARITMSGASEGDLSDETIISICNDVTRKALENKIEMEANSPSPDLIKIISMKTKLASIR